MMDADMWRFTAMTFGLITGGVGASFGVATLGYCTGRRAIMATGLFGAVVSFASWVFWVDAFLKAIKGA